MRGPVPWSWRLQPDRGDGGGLDHPRAFFRVHQPDRAVERIGPADLPDQPGNAVQVGVIPQFPRDAIGFQRLAGIGDPAVARRRVDMVAKYAELAADNPCLVGVRPFLNKMDAHGDMLGISTRIHIGFQFIRCLQRIGRLRRVKPGIVIDKVGRIRHVVEIRSIVFSNPLG